MLNLEFLKMSGNQFAGLLRHFGRKMAAVRTLIRSPFSRSVDLWWAALCLGIREGIKSTPSSWHDFVTGAVLNQDPWRIRHLELIALAEEGPKVLEEPGKVIDIANEYAATGIGC